MTTNTKQQPISWLKWFRHLPFVLVIVLVIAVVGCTTNPLTSPKATSTPTLTTAEIWKLLGQRPIRIPPHAPGQACPSTGQVLPYFGFKAGHAPAYPDQPGIPFASPQKFAIGNPEVDGWGGQKIVWFVPSSATGPVLIRGQQLDGSNPVRFNGGIDQEEGGIIYPLLTALRVQGGGDWGSYTRLKAPGCYFYQIDGLSFSGYFIFYTTFR